MMEMTQVGGFGLTKNSGAIGEDMPRGLESYSSMNGGEMEIHG
jgi:hypothetical protein